MGLFKKRRPKENRKPEPKLAAQPAEVIEEFFWVVPKALQVRRWERRDAPFRGFGSPEGKF